MKNYLPLLIGFYLIVFCALGIIVAHSQTLTDAVNNTISQDNQRIQTDNAEMTELQARIDSLNADMQAAINDEVGYNALTPAAQTSDAQIAQSAVIATPVNEVASPVSLDTQGTANPI